MTELKNKSLGEWTLAEAKEICGNTVECKRELCPFCTNNNDCILVDTDNPSNWDLSEKPRLSEAELAICKMVGAKWVSRDNGYYVCLWEHKPVYTGCKYESRSLLGYFTDTLFPSVRPGDCVCVEDI